MEREERWSKLELDTCFLYGFGIVESRVSSMEAAEKFQASYAGSADMG